MRKSRIWPEYIPAVPVSRINWLDLFPSYLLTSFLTGRTAGFDEITEDTVADEPLETK